MRKNNQQQGFHIKSTFHWSFPLKKYGKELHRLWSWWKFPLTYLQLIVMKLTVLFLLLKNSDRPDFSLVLVLVAIWGKSVACFELVTTLKITLLILTKRIKWDSVWETVYKRSFECHHEENKRGPEEVKSLLLDQYFKVGNQSVRNPWSNALKCDGGY